MAEPVTHTRPLKKIPRWRSGQRKRLQQRIFYGTNDGFDEKCIREKLKRATGLDFPVAVKAKIN